MNEKDDPILEGIRLSDICNLILGNFNEAPFPSSIAHLLELLTIKCNNGTQWHIRHKDLYDEEVEIPILYRYHHWAKETDRWLKASRKSEAERKQYFLDECNNGIITRKLISLYGFKEDAAKALAYSLMRGKNLEVKMSALGIKLKERFEDI